MITSVDLLKMGRVFAQNEIRTRGTGLFKTRLICNVATTGVVPPDNIPSDYEGVGPSKKVLGIAEKLPTFDKTLATLPSKKDAGFAAAVENNAAIVWDYAKGAAKHLIDNGTPGFTGDVGIIFDHSKYQKKASSVTYATALKNCKTAFSRGEWQNFWPAVSIRVQLGRDQQQRISSSLKITADEFKKISENLTYVGRGFAYNALTTQSASYINGTSLAQKREDALAFQKWYDSKANNFVKVIRLNISDIPFGFAPDEIINFENDPTDDAKRAALLAKLTELQIQLIDEIRKNITAGTPFNVLDFLKKK